MSNESSTTSNGNNHQLVKQAAKWLEAHKLTCRGAKGEPIRFSAFCPNGELQVQVHDLKIDSDADDNGLAIRTEGGREKTIDLRSKFMLMEVQGLVREMLHAKAGRFQAKFEQSNGDDKMYTAVITIPAADINPKAVVNPPAIGAVR